MSEQRGIKIRDFNERRVIAAIRVAGPMSRAEIARATGLSAPAASNIVQRLGERGFLKTEAKVRGHVGQPHTPLALDPTGAYTIGVKVGRRSVEAVLLDLTNGVVAQRNVEHAIPALEPTIDAARDMIDALRTAKPGVEERLVGIGIAMPWDLHAWTGLLDLPPGALDDWQGFDLGAALQDDRIPPMVVINDATAALAAQIELAPSIGRSSVLYLYLGTFVGGGLALDGKLRLGDHGNAGALGSAPGSQRDGDGRARQLLQDASLVTLEQALHADGLPAAALIRGIEAGAQADRRLNDWLAVAAPALAHTIAAGQALCDLSHVIIDGIIGPRWRDRIVEHVEAALNSVDLTGASRPSVRPGDLGWSARVLGAAIVPMHHAIAPAETTD